MLFVSMSLVLSLSQPGSGKGVCSTLGLHSAEECQLTRRRWGDFGDFGETLSRDSCVEVAEPRLGVVELRLDLGEA